MRKANTLVAPPYLTLALTMEYLENMARDEINRGFFPGAVDYQISEQEAVAE